MTAPIRQGLIILLEEYQDVFAWSYQDMPGLDSDIVQHKLTLNPGSSQVKQKLRRIKPEMSLKIKEEVRKQFDPTRDLILLLHLSKFVSLCAIHVNSA